MPHATPEPLVLETHEGGIDIAPDADAMGLDVPARRPLCAPCSRLRRGSPIHVARWDTHKISPSAGRGSLDSDHYLMRGWHYGQAPRPVEQPPTGATGTPPGPIFRRGVAVCQ